MVLASLHIKQGEQHTLILKEVLERGGNTSERSAAILCHLLVEISIQTAFFSPPAVIGCQIIK